MSLCVRVGLPSLVLLSCISPLSGPVFAGQDPIRVQSDEVLVPTVAFNKELYEQLNKMKPHHRDLYGHIVTKNEKLWGDIVVKNLTLKDFRLFEDGQEQRIQTVKLEPPAFRVVQDNQGKHPETIGTGGGIWAYPDRPATDQTTWLAWPQYVLAYVPPRSAPGSCHQIQVKVANAKLEIWTRSEYCNTPHPATDPLNGTEFGNKLEAEMHSAKDGTLDLAAHVAAFTDSTAGGRVYLSLTFPWQSLKHEFRGGTLYATIGSLIMVYTKDGALAARYTDFACCDYGKQEASNEAATRDAQSATPLSSESSGLIPNRYQAQFALPAGEYMLQVVLSDGTNFGAQQLPLTVDPYDPNRLTLSDVVLSRRVRKLSTDASEAAQQVSGSYSPLASKGVEFTPTANPQYWPSDTLFAYFEINDPLVGRQPGTTVQANMKIADARSGALLDTFAPVDTATYTTAASRLIPVGRGVLLNRLPPGEYRLEVQASNSHGTSTGWRSALFTVMQAEPLGITELTPEKKGQVILRVTALDTSNHPVTDLTSADFQIFDDGQARPITSLKVTSPRREPGTPAPLIVILFDLLNTVPRQREYIADRITKVLGPLETDDGIYLYLLTNSGALYPVRPKGTIQAAAIAQGSIGGGNSSTTDDTPPWTKQIRPLLDHAIDEVHGFRVMDYRDVAMCAVITFDRLGQIAEQLASIRGPKTILWVTSGVPNSISYPYGGCRDQSFSGVATSYLAGKCGWECRPNPSQTKCLDYTPFLQHFAAETAASDTTVSTVLVANTPLVDFASGTAADSLRQLANLTGGQVYVDTNSEVEDAINDALASVNARYQIAFAPTAKDAKYHKVRVLCTRQAVHLVATQGYFPPTP